MLDGATIGLIVCFCLMVVMVIAGIIASNVSSGEKRRGYMFFFLGWAIVFMFGAFAATGFITGKEEPSTTPP